MSEPLKKTDPQIIKELAREAEGLKANRAFAAAVGALKVQWLGELMSDQSDGPKVHELAIKLRTLEAIPRMLDSLIASQAMAAQRGPQRA